MTQLEIYELQIRIMANTIDTQQKIIDMIKGNKELGLYDEPKQETLEEAIKREYERRKFNSDFPFDPQSFKLGAKWQSKRMYSEEEVNELLKLLKQTTEYEVLQSFRDKVHQFKKK